MTGIIKDGTGTGLVAKVNENNRLYTSCIASTESEAAAPLGESYHVITGVLNLTSTGESAVMYFKNNNLKSFRLKALITGSNLGTGTTTGDSYLTKLIRNPSTGTIIDDATDVDIRCNRNFGSSKLIQDTALIYKGGEGKTITNGADHFLIYGKMGDNTYTVIDEMFPAGKSLGFTATPPTGNTSLNVYVGMIGHYEDDKE